VARTIQESRKERGLAERRRVRRRRWARGGLVTLGILLLVALFALPPLIRRELQARLSAELQREVFVGPIRINPITLSITSRDFRVLDPNGLPLVAWRRLHVNLQLRSLWQRAWVFRRIDINAPLGRLVVNTDGSLNISDLLARLQQQEPSDSTARRRPVHIDDLSVYGASFEFEDRSGEVPFTTSLGPVTFQINGFATVPSDDAAPYSFSAVTESGERFDWSGHLSAAPLRSDGRFRIVSVQLPKYAVYLRPWLAGELRDGQLSLQGEYVMEVSGGQRRFDLSHAGLELKNLVLAEAGGAAPLLALPHLALEGLQAQLDPLQVRLASATVEGGRIAVERAADGTFNLARLWRGGGGETPPAPADEGLPLDAQIDRLSITELAFSWKDAATPRAAAVQGLLQTLDVQELSLAPNTAASLQARLSVEPGGGVEVAGTVQLSPLKLSVETTLESFPVSLASPYLEPVVALQITRGTLTLNGQLDAAWPESNPPTVSWDGTIGVSSFAAVTADDGTPLASFEQLALREVAVRHAQSASVQVGEVELAGAQGLVAIRPDGTLNLTTLQPAPAGPAGRDQTPARAAPTPEVAIQRTRLIQATVVFQDRSIEPAVQTKIDQLDATIGALSSTRLDQAAATVRARINGHGTAEISGRVNPLNPAAATNLTVAVRNVDLQAAAPYIAKYAGYGLERGQLTLDVDYAVIDRNLRANNLVRLDQFTLGAPSNSPDATKLPVTLAVALLKDRNGQIEIDLPVEGNLDDPTFRFGRVIGRVIVNLLTRAATSPFALLGALLPGGEQSDPSQVLFAPGESGLSEAEQSKLAQIARALQERPALRLDIAGGADPAVDRTALQQAALEQTIRRRWWEQRREADSATPPPEELEVPADVRETVLRRWYLERYPQALVLSAEQVAGLQAERGTSARSRGETDAAESAGPFRRFLRVLGIGTAAETAEPEIKLEDVMAVAGPEVAEMEARLAADVPVGDAELSALASQRAQVVRDGLISSGIEAERLFLNATTTTGAQAKLQLR
jgi:outer membrane protein OmpA-like peptidoglycan-associated protein